MLRQAGMRLSLFRYQIAEPHLDAVVSLTMKHSEREPGGDGVKESVIASLFNQGEGVFLKQPWFESLSAPLCTTDESGVILYANHTFHKSLECASGKVVGQPFSSLVSGDQVTFVQNALQALRNEDSYLLTLNLIKANGGYFPAIEHRVSE